MIDDIEARLGYLRSAANEAGKRASINASTGGVGVLVGLGELVTYGSVTDSFNSNEFAAGVAILIVGAGAWLSSIGRLKEQTRYITERYDLESPPIYSPQTVLC